MVCGRLVGRHLKATLGTANRVPDVPGRHWTDEKWHPDEPVIDQIRAIVSAGAGVLRDADGLRLALDGLRPHLANDTGLVGYLLAHSALSREESRGGHTRTDFPGLAEPRHTLVSLADLQEFQA